MTRIAVCTSWPPGAVYAELFALTYRRFWPEDIPLHVWSEGPPDAAITAPHWAHRLQAEPGYTPFLLRASRQPLNAPPGRPRASGPWAQRFAHKVFAFTSPNLPACDWLIWLDADVETIAQVSPKTLEALLQGDVAYLGRPWFDYTETGFLAFRPSNPAVRAFLDELRAVYTSDELWTLPGWGDGDAFDLARKRRPDLKWHDLAAHVSGPNLHVWPQTALAPLFEHFKGPTRKTARYGRAL